VPQAADCVDLPGSKRACIPVTVIGIVESLRDRHASDQEQPAPYRLIPMERQAIQRRHEPLISVQLWEL